MVFGKESIFAKVGRCPTGWPSKLADPAVRRTMVNNTLTSVLSLSIGANEEDFAPLDVQVNPA